MKIGEFLKQRRRDLQISQDDLATRLTLKGQPTTKASVGHWERGRNNPPVEREEFRRALAASLEIDVNEMMAVLGFVLNESSRSPEAMLAADIMDQLPKDARQLALDYLYVLERRFAQSNNL